MDKLKQFWQEILYTMMGNFYQRYKPERYIQEWNTQIQALTHPEDVQESIQDYLMLYAIDVLRHQCTYSMGILGSNLKRWHLLTSSSSSSHQGHRVFLLVELYQILTKEEEKKEDKELQRLFSAVELFLLNNMRHWAALVDYAIARRKAGVLERLRVFCEQHMLLFDIYVHIEATYGVKLHDGMCAKKILGLICAPPR